MERQVQATRAIPCAMSQFVDAGLAIHTGQTGANIAIQPKRGEQRNAIRDACAGVRHDASMPVSASADEGSNDEGWRVTERNRRRWRSLREDASARQEPVRRTTHEASCHPQEVSPGVDDGVDERSRYEVRITRHHRRFILMMRLRDRRRDGVHTTAVRRHGGQPCDGRRHRGRPQSRSRPRRVGSA